MTRNSLVGSLLTDKNNVRVRIDFNTDPDPGCQISADLDSDACTFLFFSFIKFFFITRPKKSKTYQMANTYGIDVDKSCSTLPNKHVHKNTCGSCFLQSNRAIEQF